MPLTRRIGKWEGGKLAVGGRRGGEGGGEEEGEKKGGEG